MIDFGIIGTSPITHQFIKAALQTNKYQFRAVFSRNYDTAESFAKPYEKVDLFTDFSSFLSSEIDLVYIASPNSLHYQQAKAVLLAGKHAIVEKPMVSTPSEFEDLRQTASEKGLFLFEAARNFQEESFQTIQQFLADKSIIGGHFSYAKYSSKMPELLAGNTPNIFSADFSGGALMDLGVYAVYAAIGLIGAPHTARYVAQQLPSSVDLNGVGQLVYENFTVGIQAGKNMTSHLPSEIYTSEGTLTLNACQHISSAIFTKNNGEQYQLPLASKDQSMIEEAMHFAQVIEEANHPLADQWLDVASDVHRTLYLMRQDAGITFKADTHEN